MPSITELIANTAQSVAYASKNLAELVLIHQGLAVIPGALDCVAKFAGLFHAIDTSNPDYGYIALHLDGNQHPEEQRALVLLVSRTFSVDLTKSKADNKSITLKGDFTKYSITGVRRVIIYNYCPPTCKLVPTRVPVSEERRKQLQDELDLGTVKMTLVCEEPIDKTTETVAESIQPSAADIHPGDDVPF